MGPNIKLQGGDVCQLLMNQKSVPQMPIVMCGSVPSIRVPCNREYHTQRDRQDNVVSDKKRWRAEQEKVYLTLQDQNTLCDNKVDYDIWDLALLGILEYQDNLKLRNEVTSGPLLSQQNSEVISSSLTGCFACPIRWPLEVNVICEAIKLTFDVISVPPQGATCYGRRRGSGSYAAGFGTRVLATLSSMKTTHTRSCQPSLLSTQRILDIITMKEQ